MDFGFGLKLGTQRILCHIVLIIGRLFFIQKKVSQNYDNFVELNWNFNLKEEDIFTLGKLINNEIKVSNEETVVFKSVGMALFDLIVSKYLFLSALEKKIGTNVDF